HVRVVDGVPATRLHVHGQVSIRAHELVQQGAGLVHGCCSVDSVGVGGGGVGGDELSAPRDARTRTRHFRFHFRFRSVRESHVTHAALPPTARRPPSTPPHRRPPT